MERAHNGKSDSAIVLNCAKIYDLYETNMITKEVFDILMINNLKTSSNNDESVSMQSDEEIIDINAVYQQEEVKEEEEEEEEEEEISTSRTSEPDEKKCRRRPNAQYAQCHPDRPHHGRGMCIKCYQEYLRKRSKMPNSTYGGHRCPKCGGRKAEYAMACFKCANPKKIPQCHPYKPYFSKNMCQYCYRKYYRKNQRAKNIISK